MISQSLQDAIKQQHHIVAAAQVKMKKHMAVKPNDNKPPDFNQEKWYDKMHQLRHFLHREQFRLDMLNEVTS